MAQSPLMISGEWTASDNIDDGFPTSSCIPGKSLQAEKIRFTIAQIPHRFPLLPLQDVIWNADSTVSAISSTSSFLAILGLLLPSPSRPTNENWYGVHHPNAVSGIEARQ